MSLLLQVGSFVDNDDDVASAAVVVDDDDGEKMDRRRIDSLVRSAVSVVKETTTMSSLWSGNRSFGGNSLEEEVV